MCVLTDGRPTTSRRPSPPTISLCIQASASGLDASPRVDGTIRCEKQARKGMEVIPHPIPNPDIVHTSLIKPMQPVPSPRPSAGERLWRNLLWPPPGPTAARRRWIRRCGVTQSPSPVDRKTHGAVFGRHMNCSKCGVQTNGSRFWRPNVEA